MNRLIGCFLFLVSVSVSATDNSDIAKAISDNISSEYVTCAAYFSLVSNAVAKPNEPELSQKYKEMHEASMQGALMLARGTREDDMAMKVTLARFENYLKGMAEDIGNDFSNISILFSKYSASCKLAIEKPEEFINEIKERTINNHKNE